MDNREQTYTAIRSAIAVLDDPFTRFLEPSRYAALKRRSSGAVTGVGLEVGFDTSAGASGDLLVRLSHWEISLSLSLSLSLSPSLSLSLSFPALSLPPTTCIFTDKCLNSFIDITSQQYSPICAYLSPGLPSRFYD
jgi:hypothetical protein